jgi:hypothetical protein
MEGDKDKITQEHLKTRKRPCLNWGPNANPSIDESLEVKMARMHDVKMPPINENHITDDAGLVPPVALDLKDVPACDLLQALKGTLGLTTEHTDAILAEISNSDLIHALKGRHPNGLAGFMNHMDLEDKEDITECLDNIDLKDIKAYVKKKEKARWARRAMKKLAGF